MAKTEKSTIKIVDNQTNEVVEYIATQTPHKSTLGHTIFSELNSKGMANLQKRGFNIHCKEDWDALQRKTFGLSEDELGQRGAKWNTAEARARYKVFVKENKEGAEFEEFAPAYVEKQTEEETAGENAPKIPNIEVRKTDAEPEIVVPEVAEAPKVEAMTDTTQIMAPQIVVPTPEVKQQIVVPSLAVVPKPAVASVPEPTLSKEDVGLISKIQEYVAGKNFNKEAIIGSLSEKIGKDRANLLFEKATKVAF